MYFMRGRPLFNNCGGYFTHNMLVLSIQQQFGSGIASCQSCPNGKSTEGNDGRVQEDDCKVCPKGTYADSPDGNAQCDECVIDTFSSIKGATSRLMCQPCSNTQVSVSGQSECTTCADGTYKPSASVCGVHTVQNSELLHKWRSHIM